MAFISEIHYQNSYASSSGVQEFVEISLTADEAARDGDFTLTTYNLDGTPIDTFVLSSITPVVDPVTGLHVYSFNTITTDPNGSSPGNAEAIALTDSTLTEPISFVDIGGGTTAITATSGAAAGATSTNIPASPGGSSIQFDIDGNRIDGPLTIGTAVCIANGALIDTPSGPVLIEDLRPGAMITTKDNGPQVLRWIHSRKLSGAELRANPAIAPIKIAVGALGENAPHTALRVSPQHQMLMSSAYASLLMDGPECLVRAKDLATHNDRVSRDMSGDSVEYFHLMFDDHQIIFANGTPTESFYPGKEAMDALNPEQREELESLFPDLTTLAPVDYTALRGWEAAAVLSHPAD